MQQMMMAQPLQSLGTPAVAAFPSRQLWARQCVCAVWDSKSGHAIVLRCVLVAVAVLGCACSFWSGVGWFLEVCHSVCYSRWMMLFLYYHNLSGQCSLICCSITLALFSCLYGCKVCRSVCGVSSAWWFVCKGCRVCWCCMVVWVFECVVVP